jgi:hypothetical protein
MGVDAVTLVTELLAGGNCALAAIRINIWNIVSALSPPIEAADVVGVFTAAAGLVTPPALAPMGT